MVLSFAHLKKGKQHSAQNIPTTVQEKDPAIILQRPRAIGIMKTALLAAVNYCSGCPRFWPADDQDKANGAPYGRCMIKEDDEYEYWRSIPLKATIARCWYHMQQ